MKRFLLTLGILLPMMAGATGIRDYISRQQIKLLISECRHCEGAEVVQMGPLGTGALKGAIRLAAISDPDARDILKLIKGINGISVFDFSGCCEEDKNDITYRLEGILGKAEVLMEAKEGSDRFSLFGVVDDNSQELNDLVMYAPNDCALICLFGSIPADKAVHIIDND
ncbi:MAG: DUF4252 domain-containing protein [Bacteroidales bacterium]|nr:DUF4252 domain-containing protein [Bacteroidales bacterium]MBQ9529213.1 DUF4252 domain-containing protein [Bacteroidales bacterium]